MIMFTFRNNMEGGTQEYIQALEKEETFLHPPEVQQDPDSILQ